MTAIKIQITSFVSDSQPGWVECKFSDAWNKEHTVQEKIPIVTSESLCENSEYPRDGIIACIIIKQWVDEDKGTIFTVSTEKPWYIETLEGISEFDLLPEQLTEEYNQ